MMESQKLAMQGIAALTSAGVSREEAYHALDTFMQAGFLYCLEQQREKVNEVEARNQAIIERAGTSFRGNSN